jgi:hypothetical protein
MVRNLDAVSAVAFRQEATMRKEGDHIVETPVEARQGFLDRPVLVVLVASCVLAVVFLAVAYGLFAGA